MAESDWRRLEREWEANPADQDTLNALLAARRRAGLPVPRGLLEQRVFPPRTLNLPAATVLEVTLADGSDLPLPDPVPAGPLEIPAHREITIFPDAPHADALRHDLRALAALRPHTLYLEDLPMAGAGLDALDALPELEALELLGPYAPSPQSLARIVQHENLTALNLTDVDVSGGLERLGPRLVELVLSGGSITPDAFHTLCSNDVSLTELELWNLAVPDDALTRCAALEHLRELTLGPRVVPPPGAFAALSDLALTYLYAYRCRVTDEVLHDLARITTLRQLYVGDRQTRYTSSGLRPLAGLAQLQTLYLTGEFDDPRGLAHLPPSLRILALPMRSQSAPPHLVHLELLGELMLDLHRPEVDLRALSGLPKLETLTLKGTVDLALDQLGELSALRVLNLNPSSTHVSPRLDPLRGLTLRSLTLEIDRDDVVLDPLAEVRGLRELRLFLRGSPTDVQVAALTTLPDLETLTLRCGDWSDARATARQLQALPKLKRLKISRHPRAPILLFAHALPDCTVTYL